MRTAQSPSELGFTDLDISRLNKAMQQVSDKRTFIRLWAGWLHKDIPSARLPALLVEAFRSSING